MKWSNRLLMALVVLLIAGLLTSNMVLKNEYNKADKTDIYWNYGKVLEQPFKHLKIDGGNNTRIIFEQSPHYSVRVLDDWQRYHSKLIDAYVSNDTLFIKFVYTGREGNEKDFMKYTTLVRIFSPQLLSVEGYNTNFEMDEIKQGNIHVSMSGKSIFELESMMPDFDSLTIFEKDSSRVIFEMSPAYQGPGSFHINKTNAQLKDFSFLDLGHASIDSLNLSIAPKSGVLLSGQSFNNSTGKEPLKK